MKKYFKLIVCLLMVLSLTLVTSCKKDDGGSGNGPDTVDTLNGKTAEELYQEALSKVQGLNNYTTNSTQVITMTMQGQKMTMNQTVVAKVNNLDSYSKMYNDMESSLNMECWYVDEWLYAVSAGQRFKANITHERFQNEFMPEGSNASDSLMNLPQSWFKDIKFHTESGNKYYIEFIVSGDEYKEFMSNTALGDMVNGIDDISYKVYFDESGELGDIITEFDYVVSGINCHAISTTSISDIGSTVVTAPSGTFADYTGMI